MNQQLAFIGGVGPTEILIILTVVFLLFGAKKMPEFARGIRESIDTFKGVKKDLDKELDEVKREIT